MSYPTHYLLLPFEACQIIQVTSFSFALPVAQRLVMWAMQKARLLSIGAKVVVVLLVEVVEYAKEAQALPFAKVEVEHAMAVQAWPFATRVEVLTWAKGVLAWPSEVACLRLVFPVQLV